MEKMIVVFSFIGMLLFFFPLFLEVNVVAEDERIMFSFYLFSFIRLFCGYITFTKVAAAVHFSKKKALYLPYKNMKDEKAIFDAAEGIQLISLSVLLEVNPDKGGNMPVSVLLISAMRAAFSVVSGQRPFLRLNGDLLLSDNSTVISVGALIVFNIFTLSRAAIKIITGRIISALWKKKQKKVRA